MEEQVKTIKENAIKEIEIAKNITELENAKIK